MNRAFEVSVLDIKEKYFIRKQTSVHSDNCILSLK